MKALTVKQPYAHLIAERHKTIEIRSRPTTYRGDLLITSSANPANFVWTGQSYRGVKAGQALPAGVTICVARLEDCRPLRKADEDAALFDWTAGDERKYAWVLNLLYRTEHIPVKGALGLWNPEGKVIIRRAE